MNLFILSLANIWRRKFRNGFTIVGIAVGISAIVALLSLGEGMQSSLTDRLGPLAADIIVLPKMEGAVRFRGPHRAPRGGAAASTNLDDGVLSDLKRIKDIDIISPKVSGRAKLKVANKEYNVQIMGIDPEAEEKLDTIPEFDEGMMFTKRDKKTVLIGSRISDNLFRYRKVHARSTIDLDGETYMVAGVLKSAGNNAGGSSYDNQIVMNIDDAQRISDMDGKYSTVTVRAISIDKAEKVADDIEKKISYVSTFAMSAVLDQIREVLTTFSLFLAGIGGISLFVAAITILNNMYTAVMERRREIGTMKALGMNNRQVLVAFSIEAAILGIIGGVIGIFLAFGLGRLMGNLPFGPPGSSLAPVYHTSTILGAVLFAVIIALTSGFYPAWRASKLSPVEALSYE